MSAEVRPIRTAAEQALAEAFPARRPGLARDPRATQREAAFRRFEELGLPHRRVEDWKYTDLRALMRDAKPLAQLPSTAARLPAKNAGRVFVGAEPRRMVFVDGAFTPELSDLASLPPGLAICPMAEALAQGDPLVQ